MPKIKCICKICQNEFFVYPSEKKRGQGIYCSRKCKDKGHSVWLKSLPTEKQPHYKGGLIETICFKCGKEIKVKRCKKNKKVFCSKSCANSVHSGERPKERIKRICKNCDKIFEIHPNKLKRKDRNTGLFCSMKCRASYNIKKQGKTNTDIEIILENWLIENKINYEKNKLVEGICVDFFIKPNIVLFADGDYWHNLPKTKKRDKSQNKLLKGNDWKVIRLWGSEIKKGIRPNEILPNN